MKLLRRLVRLGLQPLERGLGTVFTTAWNPMQNLGALGFFF